MCIQVGTLREIQKCNLKVNIAIRAVYFLLFSVNRRGMFFAYLAED